MRDIEERYLRKVQSINCCKQLVEEEPCTGRGGRGQVGEKQGRKVTLLPLCSSGRQETNLCKKVVKQEAIGGQRSLGVMCCSLHRGKAWFMECKVQGE